jgi:hypothetical protein
LTNQHTLTRHRYKEHIYVSKLLYLLPINETRFTGESVLNLKMFEGIVGKNLQNVVLVTTMWDLVKEEDGKAREKELRSQFLKHAVRAGARMDRSGFTTEAAWKLIGHLSPTAAKPVLLQDEMGRQKKPLLQTTAASVLSAVTNLLNSLRDKVLHIRSYFGVKEQVKPSGFEKDVGRKKGRRSGSLDVGIERRPSLLTAVENATTESSSGTNLRRRPSWTSTVSLPLPDTSEPRAGVSRDPNQTIMPQSEKRRRELLSVTIETLGLVGNVAAVVPVPLLKTLLDLALNITQRILVSPSSRLF